MEISRLTRRKQQTRYRHARYIAIAARTIIISLQLLSWYLGNLVFTLVLITFVLSLVFSNRLNIRKLLPGLNSSLPFKRALAITFYLLLILSIISYAA